MKKFVAILKNPWFTRAYMLILLSWVLIIIFTQGEEFLKIVRTAKLHMIFLGLIFYLIVMAIANPYLHSIAYREIGCRITLWQAFRIFHLSRIGNYLPGRVWFATNYYVFSKKMNIDTELIVKNFVMLNALLFLVGSLCSLPIISLISPTMQKLLILYPFLILVLIHPRIFNKIFSRFWEKKSKKDFRYSFLVKISVLYFINYVILGYGLYFCILAFKVIDLSSFPLIVASNSASVIIGMMAIFAPAGIGVSEGINVSILSQIIPLEIAITVVVAFRMIMVLVDFSCALIAGISVAREKKAEQKVVEDVLV